MNKHTRYAPDSALRCLAFGHAWEFPEDWRRFNVDPLVSWTVAPDGREHADARITRVCTHGCGTARVTTMRLRVSGRGNLVEVVSTRHHRTYPRGFSAAREKAVAAGDQPPSRRDYRAELLARQLRVSLKASGVRMRRSDAAANIHMMVGKNHGPGSCGYVTV